MKLWGYGAKFYADTTDAEIAGGSGDTGTQYPLDAPDTAIMGFDIMSNLKRRPRRTE